MGQAFRLVKSETVPLTPELATRMQTMTPSPTERDLDPRRVQYLREKFEAGQAVSFNWAIARLEQSDMRMNGQHSSTVLCDMASANVFPEGLRVHLDTYDVDNHDGLALLFRQFDDKKSARTAGDVAGAYQGIYPALQDVPGPIAKLGVEGVVWYRRRVEQVPAPKGDERYRLFSEQELYPFLIWLGQLYSIKTPELRNEQVCAAMYATFESNEIESRRFWEQVARGGADYDDDSPATKLDTWLKEAKTGKMSNPPKAGNYYQACIYAWNAYRDAKKIGAMKADTAKGWFKVLA